jgi:hypothetical protein
MIDTIVLRIHDLEKYRSLFDYILADKKGTAHGLAFEKESTYINFKYMHFTDTNHSRMMYRSYITTPSSNYDLQIAIPQWKDYIEVSFSIPKYMYGTNVLMFTKHHDEKYIIDMMEESDMSKIADYTFGMLGNFIRQLWLEIFPDFVTIDHKDVELKRIDICWNQVFESEYDAKMYLMYQKMIKKRGARETSESKQTYETSIFYSTEYFAAKIYHKGTEYRKNDMTKNLNVNKKNRQDVFPVFDSGGQQGLSSVADRILRYEISFKKSFLQYYFWRYYYRKSVKSVSEKKELHRKMTNANTAIQRCADLEKKKVLIGEYRKRYDRNCENIRNDVQKLYDLSPMFMLESTNEILNDQVSDLDFFHKGKMIVSRRQPFTKFLYNQMKQTFLDFYNQFQVHEKVTMHTAMKRIVEYNERQGKFKELGLKSTGMYAGSMQKVNLLLQHYSMDELKKLGIIPKRTFYAWKKRLRELGIENTNVASIEIPVSHGKQDYLNLVLFSRLSKLITRR